MILILHCYVPVDNEENTWMKSSPAQIHFPNGVPPSSTPMHTLGGARKVISYSSKIASAWWSHTWLWTCACALPNSCKCSKTYLLIVKWNCLSSTWVKFIKVLNCYECHQIIYWWNVSVISNLYNESFR